MRLHAAGNDLIIMEKERLISGSQGIYTCEFTFDPSWDGYLVTAVFSTANKLINKAVVDGKCDVPHEVLRPNSRLRIGIFGNDGVRTRPTTYSEWIPVEQGTDPSGRTGRPPEPTVYEAWMKSLDDKHDEWDLKELAREKAEAERVAAEKKRGHAAIYVGSGEMPEGYYIQIDPDGDYVFGGPKIVNGYWYIWDDETGGYVNTGVKATGPKGDPGGAVLTEEDKAEMVADVIAALPNGDDVVYPEANTFTFYVDGNEYTAEKGMTWEQFMASEYNPKVECGCGCGEMYDTFSWQTGADDGVGIEWDCGPGSAVYHEESREGFVHPNDVIESGKSYLVFEGYPGDYGRFCPNCGGELMEGDEGLWCGCGWYEGYDGDPCPVCGAIRDGGPCPNGCDDSNFAWLTCNNCSFGCYEGDEYNGETMWHGSTCPDCGGTLFS